MARQRCSSSVLYDGNIVTFDKAKARVRAVYVEDGRFVAVGSDDEVKRIAPRGSEMYDLRGKVVVPGFIDCHTHFIQMGLDLMTIDLSRTTSLDEAMSMMREGAKRIPEGEWVIGTGWKESGWKDGRFITCRDLDSACPGHPVVAHRVCGHLSSINTVAMSSLGIDERTPDVQLDASGRPTGVLIESAVSIVRNATMPGEALKSKGLAMAIQKAHSLGVTSVQDNGDSSDFGVYRQAEVTGSLRVRIWLNTPTDSLRARRELRLTQGVGSRMLKLGGLKVFCDGALGARTAALSRPFSDDPSNTGSFVYERKDFDDIVTSANESGIQLAIHAIGDKGIEVVISSFENALGKNPREGHRHRIEHLELPSRAHLARMRKLNLIASMQPNFVGEWGGTEGMYVSRLGKSRASRNNPFREVLDSKVKLVFGSDCMPMSPIYGIHSAVNAPYTSQRITPFDAFSAYTIDAAYASFEENLKGSISVGKLADMVVLSDDPFDGGRMQQIGSMTVLKTVVGGEVVFDSPEAKHLVKGTPGRGPSASGSGKDTKAGR